MRKRTQKNHAYRTDHVLPNFNNISIKDPEFNDFEKVNLNDHQTSLEEKRQLTIKMRIKMTLVLYNMSNSIILDAATANAATALVINVLEPVILD